MSSNATRLGDPRDFNDLRQGYQHDRSLGIQQQKLDLRSLVMEQTKSSAAAVTVQPSRLPRKGGAPLSPTSSGKASYTDEEVQRIKADCEKKITKLKKAAEVQMRNVKLMAKDRARKLMEDTVARIKKQFQREMLHMLVEFDTLRDQVIRKDKDLKVIAKNLYEQEDEITLKNTLIAAQQLLELEREEKELVMDGEKENPLKRGDSGPRGFGLSKMTLTERLESMQAKLAKNPNYQESLQVQRDNPGT